MLIALAVESPQHIENYLNGQDEFIFEIVFAALNNNDLKLYCCHPIDGCTSGGRDPVYKSNCTTFTLTKIQKVSFPSFGPVSFGFDYQFCNQREGDEWLYDSEERYPSDFNIHDVDFTITCPTKDKKDVWFVTFGDMTSALGSGIFVQPIISYLELISLRNVSQSVFTDKQLIEKL